MAKRSNKTPQDRQGKRRSKRIKKSTFKGEAFRKTLVNTEEEDDQTVVVLGNQKDGECVADAIERKTDFEADDEQLVRENNEEPGKDEMDETSTFLNNVFRLHRLSNSNFERVVGTERLMKSY